ncbi:MAG: hypothetical protein HZA36_03615 [Parcubacteria group bacterium]|nr:hypothetical protein [Parcubacteria group bacterium]
MSELEAVLSEESFNVLQEAGVVEENETYSRTKTYILNFRNLKMISGVWANPRTLGLLSLLQEEADLEAEQKALNARRKALKSEATTSEDGDVYFPKEKKVEGVVAEFYSAKCVEIRLMKYKARAYDVSSMNYEEADKRVKQVRQRLIVVRYIIRAITFAMEMVDSKSIAWDAGSPTKNGKLEQMADFSGCILKKVTWEEEFVCS